MSLSEVELKKLIEEELEKQRKEVEHSRRRAVTTYDALRTVIFTVQTGFILALWALLLTPFGQYVGFQNDWFYVASQSIAQQKATTGDPTVVVGNPDEIIAATRNLISVLGPILIALFVWVVAFMAERRLKNYDETIERIRSEQRAEQLRMLAEQEKTRESIQREVKEISKAKEEIPVSIRNAEETIERRLRESLKVDIRNAITEETDRSVQEAISTGLRNLNEKVNDAVSGFNQRSDQLEKRFGRIADTVHYSVSNGVLTSVGKVHEEVSKLFSSSRAAEAVTLTLELIEQALPWRAEPNWSKSQSKRRPVGALDDWFNLSAVLGRHDEEGLALEVCMAGLAQQVQRPLYLGDVWNWPEKTLPNKDLIAHALQYASVTGHSSLKDLLKISGFDSKKTTPEKAWNWRNYSFTMEALVSDNQTSKAIELGKKYLSSGGTDERIVVKLAEIQRHGGDAEEAKKTLLEWLDGSGDRPSPQVITWLLDRSPTEVSAEKVIEWSSRGIRDLAMEQPTASLSNLYFKRALAYDRLAFTVSLDLSQISDQNTKGDSIEKLRSYINSALKDFSTTKQLGMSGVRLQSLDQRESALRRLANDFGLLLAEESKGGGNSVPTIKSVTESILAQLEMSGESQEAFDQCEQELSRLPIKSQQLVVSFLSKLRHRQSLPESLRITLGAFLDSRE